MPTTAAMTAIEIAARLEADILEAKRRKITVRETTNLHASSIGDPCERWLYYGLMAGAERAAITPELQALFDQGLVEEQATEADLREAGYRPLAQEVEVDLRVKGGRISGRIDFFLEVDGRRIPVEHKGLSYGRAEECQDWRELLEAPQRWARRYPGQIQSYLLQSNCESGLLALRGKESGRIRFLPVELDYEYAEGLLKKAERVFFHREAGEPPERIPYSWGFCTPQACDFHHVCQPEGALGLDERGVILDEHMIDMVNRYLDLEEAAKEHGKLEAAIKAMAKTLGRPELLIGNGIVTIQTQIRNYKEQPARRQETKIIKIRRRSNGGEAGTEEPDAD
jgi:hypothetical protein